MAASGNKPNPRRPRPRTDVSGVHTNGKAPITNTNVDVKSPEMIPGPTDIDGWQRQVYKTAEEHGWVSDESRRSVGEDLVLMHDEISELLEQWNAHAPVLTHQQSGSGVKPEGLSMEVADLAIRLLALAQTEQVCWSHLVDKARQYLDGHPSEASPPINRWHLWVSKICRWWRGNSELRDTIGSTSQSPAWLMALLWADMDRQLAVWGGPTLLDAVRIKDAYNQTRPWRHGGKRI